MTRFARVVVAVLLTGLVFGTHIVGAQPLASRLVPLTVTPEHLQAELKRGSQLEVIVGTDGLVLRGEVVNISASSLVIATPTGPTAFAIADVREVWQGRRLVFSQAVSSTGETPRAEPDSALSQPDPQWLALPTRLETGRAVTLTMKQTKGLWFVGSLEALGPSSVTLFMDGRRYTIPRGSVEKIWKGYPTPLGEPLLAGMLLGIGAGAGVAALSCLGDDGPFTECFEGRRLPWIGGGMGAAMATVVVAQLREDRAARVYDSSRQRSNVRTAVQPLIGRGFVGLRGKVSF